MKFEEVMEKYCEEKTKVFVNGMPEENGGLIKEVGEDYILFEILEGEKAEDKTRENVYIPISKIDTVSETKKIGTLEVSAEEKPKEE